MLSFVMYFISYPHFFTLLRTPNWQKMFRREWLQRYGNISETSPSLQGNDVKGKTRSTKVTLNRLAAVKLKLNQLDSKRTDHLAAIEAKQLQITTVRIDLMSNFKVEKGFRMYTMWFSYMLYWNRVTYTSTQFTVS